MTFYHTICGRTVRKSTNADTTGNRDTAECTGCPFLLPYGPFEWEAKTNTYSRDVQGHECRMPQCEIDYATRFSGSIDNRLTCAVHSLDFDFLTRVSDWIAATYPGKEIQGHFDADTIRGVEYVSAGRYRMTVNCAQNKAGEAAKAALFHQFFNDDGSRRDMTPEDEKAKVLEDIRQDILAHKLDGMTDEEAEAAVLSESFGLTPHAVPDDGDDSDDCDQYDACLCHTCTVAGCHEQCHGAEYGDVDCENCVAAKFADGAGCNACDRYQITVQPASCPHISSKGGCNLNGGYFSGEMSVQLCCTNKWRTCDRIKEESDDQCMSAQADQTCAAISAPSVAAADEQSAATADDTSPMIYSAPDSPAGAGLATSVPSDAAPVCSDLPAFDYSGLDAQTVATLHSAENMIRGARRDYVIKVADAVGMAHDELCGTVVQKLDNGRFSEKEETFRAWCASQGIGKSTAYNLLQVSNLLEKSTPNEQKVLEQAPATLLYAAAKPSAPEEAVAAVKSGDITTMPEYKALLEEIDSRDQRIKDLIDTSEISDRDRDAAKNKAAAAERKLSELDKQLEANRSLLVNIKRSNDDLRSQMQEMENRPIDVATEVDYAEVDRLAKEKADAATAELRAALEEAKKKTGSTQKFEFIATGNARDGALTCADVIRSTWKTFKPMLLLVTDDIDKKYAVEDFLAAINEVKEDAEKCL